MMRWWWLPSASAGASAGAASGISSHGAAAAPAGGVQQITTVAGSVAAEHTFCVRGANVQRDERRGVSACALCSVLASGCRDVRFFKELAIMGVKRPPTP